MITWQALDALSHQLELCGVTAVSRVVALIGEDTEPDRAGLLRAAIARTGAQAVEVRMISGIATADGPLAVLSETADIVVVTGEIDPDVPIPEDVQILHLTEVPPQDFPHANLRRRGFALTQHVENAERLIISDRHGTALHTNLTGARIDFDHGLVDDDRTHAVFPAGWAEIVPAAGSTEGSIVLMPGDANLLGRSIVNSPVRIEVVNDLITSIIGESPDADALRALLEYPSQPNAYGIAGVRIGMNPGAKSRGETLAPFDERLLSDQQSTLLAGGVTLSFGENLLADRPCTQRLSLVLPRRFVRLDGLPVVNDGVLQGDFAPDVYEC